MKNHALCVTLLLGSTLLAAAQEKLPCVMPKTACSFTRSIGVNTHFGYKPTTYNRYEDILKPRLIELGVAYIRDGTYSSDVVKKYRDVYQSAGIRVLLITRAEDAVEKAKAIGPALWAVEAINEPDQNQKEKKAREDESWEQETIAQQQALYENIKGDPDTRHLPVLATGLANTERNARLGDLSAFIEYGNLHAYAQGQHPAHNWGRNSPPEKIIGFLRISAADRPLVTTECGYHNAMNFPYPSAVSEEIAALYELYLPFVYFNHGMVKSFKYEFLDLKPEPGEEVNECHYGLVRADGTPKPSFYALKNLLAILKDSDKTFTVTPLSYQIKVAEDEVIHQTLLEKSDGNYYLALFRNKPIWEVKKRQEIPLAPVKVSLILGKTAEQIAFFYPNRSDRAEKRVAKSAEISFELGREVVLLEIK